MAAAQGEQVPVGFLAVAGVVVGQMVDLQLSRRPHTYLGCRRRCWAARAFHRADWMHRVCSAFVIMGV